MVPSLKRFLFKSDLAQKAYGYLTDKERSKFENVSRWEGAAGRLSPPPSLSVSHCTAHLPSRGLSEQLTILPRW